MKHKEKSDCKMGFNDLKLRLWGIPIAALVMPIAFFQINPWDDFGLYQVHVLVGMVFTSIYWHVDRLVVIHFRKKYPLYSDYKKRLILQVLVILAFTLSFCRVSDFFMGDFPQLNEAYFASYSQILIASLMTTMLVLAIYESHYAIGMWKTGIQKYEKLQRENTQAKLDSLKNQVNPHFLFNSLNTLSAIIVDDPPLAVKFVEKLSAVYRYILEIKDRELITLEEELRAVESYEFLLKIRFDKNISFQHRINKDALKMYLVPLAIQMLLENAVKHNVISSADPLEISITTEGDKVVISNNYQPKNIGNDSTKTGLANIRRRYQLLAQEDILIENGSSTFRVSLPLLSLKSYDKSTHH